MIFFQLTAKHLQKPAMKISELTQLSNLSLNSPPQSQQQQPPAPPAPLTSQQLQQGIKLNCELNCHYKKNNMYPRGPINCITLLNVVM